MRQNKGVPPQAGSGHSPKGGAAKASPAKPSVPNAVLETMDAYLAAARETGHTPHSWWMSPPIYDLFEGADGARPTTHCGLPIEIHDEWSWGWMLIARANREFAIPRPFELPKSGDSQ